MVCSALVTSSGKISAYKDQELDLFTNSFNTSAAKICNIKDNHTASSNTDITFWKQTEQAQDIEVVNLFKNVCEICSLSSCLLRC